MKFKKGDNVIVTAGKHKGVTGKVSSISAENSRISIEGIQGIKRHQKARSKTEKGSIVERPTMITLSNVMHVDPKTGKATRIGMKTIDGKKVRVAKKSGQELK